MSATGKRLATVAVFVAVAVGGAIAFAHGSLTTLFTVTPAEMKFVANPAQPGLSSSVLVGDPGKSGIYVMHLRIPAAFKLAPHSHAEAWRVATILSGTLYYGQGDTFDEGKLKALGPGSVIVEPRDQPHFAMTRDDAVTLQLVAEGPAATTPVRK